MLKDLGLNSKNNKETCGSVLDRVKFYFVKSFRIYLYLKFDITD
jgi:hypothetical protein